MHGQDTAELVFDDVLVPADEPARRTGQGLRNADEPAQPGAADHRPAGRSRDGDGAVAETIAYTKDRQAFGAPLFDLQHTRLELAEVATLAHAGRVFIDNCIQRQFAGELDTPTASMAKWWLTDLQCQVIDSCLQLFGGYGYMKEYLISRLYADARVQKIYGGANEVMKDVIARSL